MPEAKRVSWAPRAQQDLRTIWRYYARVASPEIADKILREIAQAGEQLGERVLQWKERSDLQPGLRSALIHPYTAFYRVTDGAIEIVRVLHERRDFPGIFRGRR